MAVDEFLLGLLACPESRAPLVLVEDGEATWLVSTDAATRRRYAVRDGIPILLIDESEQLDEETWRAQVAAGRAASGAA